MSDTSPSVPTAFQAILPDRFKGNLTNAEKLLLSQAPRGAFADCAPTTNARDTNPQYGPEWDAQRKIDANLIVWLCVNPSASKLVDSRGITIEHARITGKLDLSFAVVPFPLSVGMCYLEDLWNLSYSRIPLLNLQGCFASQSLTLDGAQIEGDLFLRYGFTSIGELRLLGTRIDGDLDCTEANLRNPGAMAMVANNAQIAGNALLSGSFSSQGIVQFPDCQIGGDLNCAGAFDNQGGTALSCSGASVKESVVFENGFSARGLVSLVGADIQGGMACNGSFANPASPQNIALDADSAVVHGNLKFGTTFKSQGVVSLPNIHVMKGMYCSGSFQNQEGNTISAPSAHIDGDMYLNQPFVSDGQLEFGGIFTWVAILTAAGRSSTTPRRLPSRRTAPRLPEASSWRRRSP